jgi:hypothetical protein
MAKKYSATLIGLIFTGVSLLLTFSFIWPMLTILPAGVFLETVFSGFFEKDPFDTIGNSVLITLFIAFLLAVFIFYRIIFRQMAKENKVKIRSLIWFFVILQFIVHSMFFYFDTSFNWSRAGDGQFIFGIIDTFPISSLSFVILGFITDVIKNNKTKKEVNSL